MRDRNRYRNSAGHGGFVRAVTGFLCLAFAGCGVVVERDGPGSIAVDADSIGDAVPRAEPRSRYGNPDSYEALGRQYRTLKTSTGFKERGIASWYGKKFHGRRTSSGEIYDMYKMTAAHKHLPLPTYVRVTNLENERSVVVKVNDRGPFHENRIIDLSYVAALKLGVAGKGTAFVEVSAIEPELPPAPRAQKPGPVPASVDADRESGVYLQIGAFNDRLNARRLSERLARELAESVRIRATSDSGKAIYRVQVGPIASVEFADQLVETLTGLGIDEHHFVIN